MQIYVSVLVGLIGLLMFALSKTGDVKEIGRIMFFCGLFVFLLELLDPTIKLLKG